MGGDRLVERQEPDGRLTLLTVLPVERVKHFLDRFGRAEELIEVWGHSFRERQEPGRRLPLLTVLPVERVEDLLRVLGRAEDQVQQGSDLLLEPELRQRLPASIPGAGRIDRGRRIDHGERRGSLAVLQGREKLFRLPADTCIDWLSLRRSVVGDERLLRRLLGPRPLAQAPLAAREMIAGSTFHQGVRGRHFLQFRQQFREFVTRLLDQPQLAQRRRTVHACPEPRRDLCGLVGHQLQRRLVEHDRVGMSTPAEGGDSLCSQSLLGRPEQLIDVWGDRFFRPEGIDGRLALLLVPAIQG